VRRKHSAEYGLTAYSALRSLLQQFDTLELGAFQFYTLAS